MQYSPINENVENCGKMSNALFLNVNEREKTFLELSIIWILTESQ